MKKALVVWGGWDGHTPKESVEIFIPWLKTQGYEVAVSNTLDSYQDKSLMESRDLVVQCVTMGKLTAEQAKGLLDAVDAGCGLVGWHGGIIDSFRENTEYQFMTGGQWVAHPGGCIPSYTVSLKDGNHEITRGLGGFELKDTEQYYIHFDPCVHVLCTTVFHNPGGADGHYPDGTVMPYAYTRQWNKGRVFVACWGHTWKDFNVAPAREIVERAMIWATRK
jgi:type 1 glutamine amidotransferase